MFKSILCLNRSRMQRTFLAGRTEAWKQRNLHVYVSRACKLELLGRTGGLRLVTKELQYDNS